MSARNPFKPTVARRAALGGRVAWSAVCCVFAAVLLGLLSLWPGGGSK